MAEGWGMSEGLRGSGWYRRVEVAIIFVFMAASVVVLLANPARSSPTPLQGEAQIDIRAQANAMPHQGWAPMAVYFSAYGSQGAGGDIVKYEWDLDGNGLYDTEATPAGGYASYTYNKPGVYTVSLRVTDAQGYSAVDQVVVQVRHPASSSVDYWSIFDDSQVQRVEVRLTTQDWGRMWADPSAEVMVPADAVVFGERLEQVGFRMRGQFSLRESKDKKPWKIDTDAYIDGQEFRNLRQLMFINNIGDPTLLREKLAYDMMHFAGVPASHVSFVEVWIDFSDDDSPAVFWGVYTLVERVDNKFLGNRFSQDSKGGNLYKASHAQRGPMDLIYYGDRIEAYPTQNGQYAYGKMNNEEAADYNDIVQLCYTIDGAQYANPEDFAQALEGVFNVDVFLRYMAVVVALGNWDIYPNTGNNFYLFNNPVSGKFEWIPWDLSWGEHAEQALFTFQGPRLLSRAPLYDNVFQVEAYRRKYAAYLDLLARHWFNYEHIYARAEYYHNLIAPYVSQGSGDKMFFGANAMFPVEAFENAWAALADFAGRRSEFILTELAEGK